MKVRKVIIVNKKFISVISILAIVGLAGCDDTSTSLISQTTSTTSQTSNDDSTSTEVTSEDSSIEDSSSIESSSEASSSTIGGFPYNPNLPASVKSYYSVMDYSISDMATLKTDFGALINDHHDVGYDGLKEVYRTSDIKKDGTVWDIYSDTSYSFNGSEAYGNYKEEGDAFNREHTVPKSWFGKASPMLSDAFHVYPSDGKVNGLRNNYEYGNVLLRLLILQPMDACWVQMNVGQQFLKCAMNIKATLLVRIFIWQLAMKAELAVGDILSLMPTILSYLHVVWS